MSANISIFVPHSGCPHKCSFCDQNAITGKHSLPSAADVTATVEKGLEYINDPKSTEIAFFGGSFTAIDRAYMTELLDAAFPFVKSGRVKGIRVSTRPDAIDDEILDALESRGVCAVELGAQSMDNDVLEKNLRGHTAEQVESAAELIKSRGFELGLQMMTGLPGDTPEGAWYTARELAALSPAEVRIYPTVVLDGTRMGEWYRQGIYQPPGVRESVPLCAGLLDFFEDQGIRVIRLGLHASRSLEERLLGGAYHPAFRELCEGELLVQRLLRGLAGRVPGPVTVRLNPRDRSKFTGPHRQNLTRLAELGWQVTIREDTEIPAGQILPELE